MMTYSQQSLVSQMEGAISAESLGEGDKEIGRERSRFLSTIDPKQIGQLVSSKGKSLYKQGGLKISKSKEEN